MSKKVIAGVKLSEPRVHLVRSQDLYGRSNLDAKSLRDLAYANSALSSLSPVHKYDLVLPESSGAYSVSREGVTRDQVRRNIEGFVQNGGEGPIFVALKLN